MRARIKNRRNTISRIVITYALHWGAFVWIYGLIKFAQWL